MRKIVATLIALSCILGNFESSVAASPVIALGKSCNKPGLIQQVGKVRLQCIITGAKTASWKKYTEPKSNPVRSVPVPLAVPTPSADPIPTGSTSFSDLYANRLGISRAAWAKSQSVFEASTSVTPPIEIFTGPNTKPYETNANVTVDKVTKLISGTQGIKKVNVFYYTLQDVDWAASLVQSMMGAIEYEKGNRQQGGPIVSCFGGGDCNRSTAWTTQDGTAYLLLGVTANPDQYETNYGVADSEYYNAIVKSIYLSQNALLPQTIPSIYAANQPPFWLHLGGEIMSSCLGGSGSDFQAFEKCTQGREGSFGWGFPQATFESVTAYLDISNVSGMWRDSHYAYMNEALPIGTDLMEIFLALKGPSVLIDFDTMMSQGKSFVDAFQTEFGTTWQSAEPEIAKVIWDKYQNRY